METLLLASSSPRRHQLLTMLGIPFIAMDPDIDETLRDSLCPRDRVLQLAADKALAAASRRATSEPRLVLAADTLVCVTCPDQGEDGTGQPEPDEEHVLGKPENREDAARMLRLLSGRSHIVHTGLVLLDRSSGARLEARSDSSVRFSPLSEEEIGDYLDSGEWRGVAGAYRVQGWTGLFIERIEGSWSGIMGLPIHELYDILRSANYRLKPMREEARGPLGFEPAS